MADDLTPGQVRARQFDVARKGYERGQVDVYLAELAERLSELESQLDASGSDLAIGIDDEEALARELHTIGEQVGEILESARAAAEGMRVRATDDASSWRTAAEDESTAMVAEATEQTQALRASAWNEGTSLLAAAAAEADAIVATAKEEALFMRAEAEREALRLTGDARRDREETIRATRLEADQIVESARLESEGVLSAAAQQAELAQERARALEDRRSELLGELEATRASIADLEAEIDSRRRELEPEPEPEVPAERTHHTSDGGSVRIVASSSVVELEPVDAEELAAEVEALRASDDVSEGVRVIPANVGPDPAPNPADVDRVLDDAPQESEPEPAAPAESIADAEPEEPPPVAPAKEDAVPVAVETLEPASDSVTDEPTRRAETTDAEDKAETDEVEDITGEIEVPDDLGALFAQLRDASKEPPPAVVEPPATSASTDEAESDESLEEPEAVDTTSPPEPVSEPVAETATAIPAQNTALRTIKRSLVDLQNEALEHLRTDPAWSPEEAFTDRFREPFRELADTIGDGADADAGAAFGVDLYDALTSALEHARDAGSGDREVAASASKVFRTWRSDEAERRVFGAVVAAP